MSTCYMRGQLAPVALGDAHHHLTHTDYTNEGFPEGRGKGKWCEEREVTSVRACACVRVRV